MKDYGTLSEAIKKLKNEEGYICDFNLKEDCLGISENEEYDTENFKVDKIFRFEGISNPDDNAILYAITTSDGRKGTLVDGYGISGGQVSKQMLEKLHIR